ncbi:hypothetical protein BDN70DRAFT_297787 [Pholiota conissans]|uniref:Uncharacterized protein n=1 Tax=Pholiota conissans TaxID=109636 RepID=A0A9P6CVE1_9AGAR|nr:hypothetical protein BDN70DRAFT_297787 [Pholiota conissans]
MDDCEIARGLDSLRSLRASHIAQSLSSLRRPSSLLTTSGYKQCVFHHDMLSNPCIYICALQTPTHGHGIYINTSTLVKPRNRPVGTRLFRLCMENTCRTVRGRLSTALIPLILLSFHPLPSFKHRRCAVTAVRERMKERAEDTQYVNSFRVSNGTRHVLIQIL